MTPQYIPRKRKKNQTFPLVLQAEGLTSQLTLRARFPIPANEINRISVLEKIIVLRVVELAAVSSKDRGAPDNWVYSRRSGHAEDLTNHSTVSPKDAYSNISS